MKFIKKFVKWFLIVFVVLVVLGIIFGEGDDSAPSDSSTTQTTVTSSSKSEESSSTEAESEADLAPTEDYTSDRRNNTGSATSSEIEHTRSILQQSYSAYGVVRYEPEYEAFILTPTDPEFIEAINTVINGQTDVSVWNNMTQSLVELSSAITDTIGSGYMFVIENPYETDKVIFAVADGQIISDGVAKAATNN